MRGLVAAGLLVGWPTLVPVAGAEVYGIATAVPSMPGVGAGEVGGVERTPRSLPAVGVLLPHAASSSSQELSVSEPTPVPPAATLHPWLVHHQAMPDVFEEFTNAVTSNRQRYVVGVSLSDYAVTGLRVAVRF